MGGVEGGGRGGGWRVCGGCVEGWVHVYMEVCVRAGEGMGEMIAS